MMKKMTWTAVTKPGDDRPTGIEVDTQDAGMCQSCEEGKARFGVTLWRKGNGLGFRVCDSCANALAMALIRQT